MTPPRLQFTIKGLLWATFWAAIIVAAMTVPSWRGLSRSDPVKFAFLLGLCAAAGALFGRARMGLVVGIVLWLMIVGFAGRSVPW